MSVEIVIQSLVQIVTIHADRIRLALNLTKALWPLHPDKIDNVLPEDLGYLELLSSRFAKMQSLMGEQLFPKILEYMREDIEGMGFLDRLYLLEKLHIIDSAEQWRGYRELRNHLAHEYPDKPDLICEYMNNLHLQAQSLLLEWEEIQKFISEKIQKA